MRLTVIDSCSEATLMVDAVVVTDRGESKMESGR